MVAMRGQVRFGMIDLGRLKSGDGAHRGMAGTGPVAARLLPAPNVRKLTLNQALLSVQTTFVRPPCCTRIGAVALGGH